MPQLPVQMQIPVAWGDMDAFGHVNNVMYLRYFESARIRYFEELLGSAKFDTPIKPVVAEMSCTYRKPVFYPDTLTLHVGVPEIGNSSMQMVCEMYNTNDELVAIAKATIVMFDFSKGKAARISATSRHQIESFQV